MNAIEAIRKIDLQRILNTPPTQRRLPSEIPETPSPITSPSRASTQSLSPPKSSVYATQDSYKVLGSQSKHQE